ncbi:MAG: MaoC family dehydratase N-terminal domain-containing protein [Acidobacteriota bacterium]
MSYDDWIGRSETCEDVVTAWPLTALAATLDREDALPQPGDPLPPLWHWLYFLPVHRQSELGSDGHPQRGGFLPPVDLPRRMWAGGRFEFQDSLRVGDVLTRTSRIADVREKQGRSGRLLFVGVRHEIHSPRGFALAEEHDIVYRDNPVAGEAPAATQYAPSEATWQRTIHPDDVLLFRYSALTFNGHRIHYDRRYCLEEEGYPGLVVHGPLLATLLLDLVRRNVPRAAIQRFEFRAVSPVFDTEPFVVCGKPESGSISLWVRSSQGRLAMTASAELVSA